MSEVPYERRKEFSELCPLISDGDETIEELLRTNRSISRFGDGELFMAFNGMSLPFQSTHENLVYNLKSILAHPTDSCAVALPHSYFYKSEGLRTECEEYIEGCFFPRMRGGGMLSGIRYDTTYLDTNFGIFYHHYEIGEKAANERFERIKDIFRGKRVLLVTGDRKIEGYRHNIFSDAGSELDIVYAEQSNAFMKYTSLRDSVLSRCGDSLVIAICGPCATVLSYDLSNNYGVRCLDMGHFAKEYNFFKSGMNPYSSKTEASDFFTT
jgi:hypothetical protein